MCAKISVIKIGCFDGNHNICAGIRQSWKVRYTQSFVTSIVISETLLKRIIYANKVSNYICK